MALVTIEEQYLEDIADAIRDKKACADKYKPKNMAAAIRTIEGSGGSDPAPIGSERDLLIGFFQGTGITSLTIPKEVTFLRESSLPGDFVGIEEINVEEGSQLQSMGGGLTVSSPTIINQSNGGIPDGVKWKRVKVDLTNATQLKTLRFHSFTLHHNTDVILPNTIERVEESFFGINSGTHIYFTNKPNFIAKKAFYLYGTTTGDKIGECETDDENEYRINKIFVPWSEGEVANAPWGLPYPAEQIQYNYQYTG